MAKIKRIQPLSLAKMSGTIYGVMGLVLGGIITMSAFWGNAAPQPNQMPEGVRQLAFVIMPVFYGVIGFVFGYATGWLYNILVQWVGPIEIDIES